MSLKRDMKCDQRNLSWKYLFYKEHKINSCVETKFGQTYLYFGVEA